jgi:hypothetical protein
MGNVESGTHAVSRGTIVAEVESGCAEIELAVAEAGVCLQFLGEFTTGVSHVAVKDAVAALDRVSVVIEALRRDFTRRSVVVDEDDENAMRRATR